MAHLAAEFSTVLCINFTKCFCRNITMVVTLCVTFSFNPKQTPYKSEAKLKVHYHRISWSCDEK